MLHLTIRPSPRTVVPEAMLSPVEMPRECVLVLFLVLENGLESLQFVKVSKLIPAVIYTFRISCTVLIGTHKLILIKHKLKKDILCTICVAITCLELPAPVNGQISYAVDMFVPFDYSTVAIYSCDTGYGLSGGDLTRSCEGDDSSTTGSWSGSQPTCEGGRQNI